MNKTWGRYILAVTLAGAIFGAMPAKPVLAVGADCSDDPPPCSCLPPSDPRCQTDTNNSCSSDADCAGSGVCNDENLCSGGGGGCWFPGTDCPPGAVRTDTLLYKECLNFRGACIGTAQTLGTSLCNGTHNKYRNTFACCATEPLTTKPVLLYPADGGKVSGLTAELTWEGLTDAQWGTSCENLSKTYEVHVKAGEAGTWAVLGTVDSTTTSLLPFFFLGDSVPQWLGNVQPIADHYRTFAEPIKNSRLSPFRGIRV
jgi:hypothetical protein